ncbi:Abi family protein [Bifidobacterium sp. 64T4]|uniref:Abi family protein n=1 Tax=Bifidobacterium pongonis TaxID=2834432 RepID=UPI001C57D174|nr:Abi family protein [Bifidobacterium pongonis]MBW3094940.1 Abi family protein [Bifidobacterium pongonis]
MADVTSTSLQDLQEWFSAERMETYIRSAQNTRCDAVDLYVWNERISKALLEDIAHVEVLLRNFISKRLAEDSGRADWYHDNDRFRFSTSKSTKFRDSVVEIERNIRHAGKQVLPGRVISGMMLGSWCFLLTGRLEQTVWKAIVNPRNGGMPNYPLRKRSVFERHVKMMRDLRNRLSHQEHIVMSDFSEESRYLDECCDNLIWIARMIDPKAADWIQEQSRVRALRHIRPLNQ